MARRFIFVDHATKKLYISPEFSGSQEESTAGGNSPEPCGLSGLFNVNSLDSFVGACEKVQRRYRKAPSSSQKASVTEVRADQLNAFRANEAIFIIEGQLVPAPSGWDGTVSGLCEHIDHAVMIAQALTIQADPQGAPSLEYEQTLRISDRELAVIHRYLNASAEEDYQSENETITHTAVFPNGMQMDVKCCGSQDGPSWTEAVLFDRHGCELTHTEVCEDYMGVWALVHDGIRYVTHITTVGNVLTLYPVKVDTEGICPLCSAKLKYVGVHAWQDCSYIPWECPSCGATGQEGYNRVFNRHENIRAGDGTWILNRR